MDNVQRAREIWIMKRSQHDYNNEYEWRRRGREYKALCVDYGTCELTLSLVCWLPCRQVTGLSERKLAE